MNDIYTYISVTDMGEGELSSCDNCGRPIRYVVCLENSTKKKYYVGTECTKTLAAASISNEYSMNEAIKAMKEVAEAKKLVTCENCRIFKGGDYFVIVAKNGKNPKKVTVKRTFDLFTGEYYSFIDAFMDELTKRDDTVKSWCYNDVFKYYDLLKK